MAGPTHTQREERTRSEQTEIVMEFGTRAGVEERERKVVVVGGIKKM